MVLGLGHVLQHDGDTLYLTRNRRSTIIRKKMELGTGLKIFKVCRSCCWRGGRTHQYELRRGDKLVKAVLKLFQSEKERNEALYSTIKDQIKILTPYARAVWIHDFPNIFGDPMVLGVLHETKRLANYIHSLKKRLYQIERKYDLTVEVNGYTKADLPNLDAGQMAY